MIRFRKCLLSIMLGAALLIVAPAPAAQSAIPIAEIIKEGVKRVIKAFDLMIQRLQNKTIGLQNVARVLENKLSQLKLQEIAQWTERQRQLHKKYYDDLWKVRNTIASYRRIRQILTRQEQIIREYGFTWRMIAQDKHFTRQEIDYMYRVYTGILRESAYNLDQLFLIVDSFKLQMTDASRLKMINNAGEKVEQNYADLRQFNNQNIQLSLARARDTQDIESVRKLYGLSNQ